MKELKKHLYEFSADLAEFPIDDNVHIPSEIFKEVALQEYLKMKNENSITSDEKACDDVIESIVSETFRNYNQISSHIRATVDYKIFKTEYIYFLDSIQKIQNLKSEKIMLLKNIISEDKNYDYSGRDKNESNNLLNLHLKDFAEHYWHNKKISKHLVPFYIILYALIALNVSYNKLLYGHQDAIARYKKHMNDNMRHALEWIVSCCVELYLNNEQFMFHNKITVSGITAFLEHFNYSKYCIKQQFYDLLKSLYKNTLYLENSSSLLAELRAISFIEQVHSMFKQNQYKWKLVSKWLKPKSYKKTGLGYMSADYRMIKKYLCQYFEIKDNRTNIERGILNDDSNLFDYSIDKKYIDEHINKIDSNYLFSIMVTSKNS